MTYIGHETVLRKELELRSETRSEVCLVKKSYETILPMGENMALVLTIKLLP